MESLVKTLSSRTVVRMGERENMRNLMFVGDPQEGLLVTLGCWMDVVTGDLSGTYW